MGSFLVKNCPDYCCNEHDACYDTYGKSKQECDNAFHNRMLGICARDHNTILGRPLKIACNGRADAYYVGVRDHAQDAYNKAQAASAPSQPLVANPLATGDYYIKRVGEHCEWLLTHTGLTPEWQLIQSSAQKDAGNTDSEYYRNRLAGHCQYFLSHTDRTDKWNVIEDSARKDAGIPLVSR